MGTTGIAACSVRGTVYSTAGNILGYAVAIISSIVLARIPDPDYLGVVGLAGVIIQCLGRLKVLGFEFAFVNRQADVEAAASTFLALQLTTSGALIAAAILAAPVLAITYGGPSPFVVMSLTAVVLLTTTTVVYRHILSKELLFRELTTISFAAGLVGAGSSIGLAMAGFGLWALVLGEAPRVLAGFPLARRACPFRFGLRPDREMVKWPLEFGPYWHTFLAGVPSLILGMLDDFLVGTLAGTRSLGFYSRGSIW